MFADSAEDAARVLLTDEADVRRVLAIARDASMPASDRLAAVKALLDAAGIEPTPIA